MDNNRRLNLKLQHFNSVSNFCFIKFRSQFELAPHEIHTKGNNFKSELNF